MSIKKYGSAILRSKAKPVTEFDGALEQTVEDMKKTMAEANGVGLSANQVGIPKALFIARLSEDGEVKPYVNPTLILLSDEIEKAEEGCLSIPGIWVEVERYLKLRLEAQDIKGNPVELELEGHPARVVQHEMDHLNGVLIIDRIPPAERRRIADQLEEIRNENS
jgi:peptide deformylase